MCTFSAREIQIILVNFNITSDSRETVNSIINGGEIHPCKVLCILDFSTCYEPVINKQILPVNFI